MKLRIAAIALLLTSCAFGQESASPADTPSASRESRHPKRLWALAGAVGFAVAADVYDVRQTEKGLKAGVSVEGNTWLVPSARPTTGQLYRRDLFVIGLSASPSVATWIFRRRRPELFFAGLGAPATAGLKHIQDGKAWGKLLSQK